MFLVPHATTAASRRFPRIRGDVPYVVHAQPCGNRFSPHTRGCSAENIAKGGRDIGFPRIRGDVPSAFGTIAENMKFSPHTRGCSCRRCSQARFRTVFPAYAGMFPLTILPRDNKNGFPRIRGDVPLPITALATHFQFSPHTRGCSLTIIFIDFNTIVFPAYAGMFRTPCPNHAAKGCFPRIRGDVPEGESAGWAAIRFSPHTRGCSLPGGAWFLNRNVFPAYAGMFRY